MMRRLSHPFIAELKRFVANQNTPLGPVVMALSELIKVHNSQLNRWDQVQVLQRKLSEVTDMIQAAHVFHRCVRDYSFVTTPSPKSKVMHQDNIMSLLVGDYLLAQSSVDLADLRYPKTVGLIARGLEDYTRGEFLKSQLFSKCRNGKLDNGEILNGLEKYSELTCGSLLSNACLSAALLAGYPDIDKEDNSKKNLGNIVYNFGFHMGSAHRLIEFLYCPNTNSQADKEFLSSLDVSQFSDSIRSHIDLALELLFCLPEGEKRSTLIGSLDKMRERCSSN